MVSLMARGRKKVKKKWEESGCRCRFHFASSLIWRTLLSFPCPPSHFSSHSHHSTLCLHSFILPILCILNWNLLNNPALVVLLHCSTLQKENSGPLFSVKVGLLRGRAAAAAAVAAALFHCWQALEQQHSLASFFSICTNISSAILPSGQSDCTFSTSTSTSTISTTTPHPFFL